MGKSRPRLLLLLFCLAVAAAEYVQLPGALSAGNDVRPPLKLTLSEAKATCDGIAQCEGFTRHTAGSIDAATTYFKSSKAHNGDPSWATYLKANAVDPPVLNFTVGGLDVGLRANSRTVQILGTEFNRKHDGGNFSWVPPLTGWNRPDRSSALCQNLGDITIRVRPASATGTGGWSTYASAWGAQASDAAIPTPAGKLPPGVFSRDDITGAMKYEAAAPPTETCPHGMQRPVRLHRDLRTDAPHYVTTRVDECVPGPLRGSSVSFDSFPLAVTREFSAGPNNNLVMTFTLRNTATSSVRIGGFGFVVAADDDTGGMQLPQIAATNSFVEASPNLDGGYAEWVRVVGNETLLVIPHAPGGGAPLEAWRPVMEDCTFGGSMSEWVVHSEAWSEEWLANNTQHPYATMNDQLNATGVWPLPHNSPWPNWHGHGTVKAPVRPLNPPTGATLAPGESKSYSVKFVLASASPASTNAAMRGEGAAVVRAVPGFIVPVDATTAALYIAPPAHATLAASTASPAGALSLAAKATPVGTRGFVKLPMQAHTPGARVRVVLNFTDGTSVAVQIATTVPQIEAATAYGAHLAHDAWVPRDHPDPFGRSASAMPYDRQDRAVVFDDSRAYDVGLSDDAGAGQTLALATRVMGAADSTEAARLSEYAESTLLGVKPDVARGPLRSLQEEDWTVRMTLFYYPCDVQDPKNPSPWCKTHWNTSYFKHDYTEQSKCGLPGVLGGPIWCMTEDMANMTYRGYNVPHQTAVHYALYTAARFNERIELPHTWETYLDRAARTSIALGTPNVGLMDGTIFRFVLDALLEEALGDQGNVTQWKAYAEQLSANMENRAQQFAAMTFPYGSEFNFDSTGQEEVYVWLSRFNYTELAYATMLSVRSYMRRLPTYVFNGAARSYGDLGNNGKWFVNRGVSRGSFHYRAGLNAIVTAEAYRRDPTDASLLELSSGAWAGNVLGIEPETGAPSMMLHAVPFMLEHDPRSGDFGLGFFGHWAEAASYVHRDEDLGEWICFGCDSTAVGSGLAIVPRDMLRRRVYVASVGLYVSLRNGRIETMRLEANELALKLVGCGSKDDVCTSYSFSVSAEAPRLTPGGGFRVEGASPVRGAWAVNGGASVEVRVTWER